MEQEETLRKQKDLKSMTLKLKTCDKGHQKEMTDDRQKKMFTKSLVSKEFEFKTH